MERLQVALGGMIEGRPFSTQHGVNEPQGTQSKDAENQPDPEVHDPDIVERTHIGYERFLRQRHADWTDAVVKGVASYVMKVPEYRALLIELQLLEEQLGAGIQHEDAGLPGNGEDDAGPPL